MILVSALCFGSYGVWARLLGDEFGVFCQGWVRSALILAVLLPLGSLSGVFKRVQRADRMWFSVTMLFTVFTQAPLYFAFNHLPLGTASFIFYGFFLLTSYLIGWAFLAERINWVKIVSFGMALVGLFLTFRLSLAAFSLLAMALAAFNGVASGGEIATSKKSTEKYSSLQLTAYSWILILITHLPISILAGEKQIIPAFNQEWAAMLGYAVSGLAGFWLAIEGFKYVDASIGSLIGLLEIIFSAVFGIFFFQDQMTLSVFLGGAIILCSAILPDLYALRYPQEKPIPPPPPL